MDLFKKKVYQLKDYKLNFIKLHNIVIFKLQFELK